MKRSSHGSLSMQQRADIARRLRETASRIGIQTAVALTTNTSVRQLQKYFQGEVGPTLTVAGKLARAAGVSLDWIYDGSDAPPSCKACECSACGGTGEVGPLPCSVCGGSGNHESGLARDRVQIKHDVENVAAYLACALKLLEHKAISDAELRVHIETAIRELKETAR